MCSIDLKREAIVWLMDNGAHRQLAADGSDAVGEDDFRPAHHPGRVRSPCRRLPRPTRPSSIPRRTLRSLSLCVYIYACLSVIAHREIHVRFSVFEGFSERTYELTVSVFV